MAFAVLNSADISEAGGALSSELDSAVETLSEAIGAGGHIGDIAFGLVPPDATFLPADGSAYLKSAYPAAATAFGSIADLGPGIMRSNWAAEAWRAVVWGPTPAVFVSVGDNGAISTTANGQTWTPRTSGTQANLTGVIWANSMFVAWGDGGVLLTSPDGVTWTIRTVPFSSVQAIKKVVFMNSLFVAVGQGGVIATSSNGTAWTQRTSGVTTDLNSVYFGNSIWVVVGASSVILTAPDPTSTWTSRTGVIALDLVDVIYVFSVWVIIPSSGGNAQTATDPTSTWTSRTTGITLLATARFVVANTQAFIVPSTVTTAVSISTNGTTWATSINNAGFGDILYDGAKLISTRTTTFGIYSKTGVFDSTWSASQIFNITAIHSLAWNGSNLYVGIGLDGSAVYSANGTTWLSGTRGNNTPGYAAAAYGAGIYVVAGSAGAVLTSSDLVTWTAQLTGFRFSMTDITFAAGLFVAVGTGNFVMTSPDGVNWTQRTAATTAVSNFTRILFAAGLFVIVGTGGYLLTSPDAITWTQRQTPTSQGLSDIAYGAGVFVAIGNAGAVMTSANGINWTLVPAFTKANLNRIAYGNGVFLIAGSNVFRSSNGTAWTEVKAPVIAGAVIFNGEIFIVSSMTTVDGIRFVSRDTVIAGINPASSANGLAFTTSTGAIFTQAPRSYNPSTHFVVPFVRSNGPGDAPINSYVKMAA